MMDDVIYRQDVLDALDITPLEVHDYELAVGVIKDIPSAQQWIPPRRCIDCEAFNKSQLLVPQNEHMKWTPCEKKMPEVYQKAIVIDKEGNMMIGTYTNWGWIFPAYFAHDPLAWMPLPKPYKGEEK